MCGYPHQMANIIFFGPFQVPFCIFIQYEIWPFGLIRCWIVTSGYIMATSGITNFARICSRWLMILIGPQVWWLVICVPLAMTMHCLVNYLLNMIFVSLTFRTTRNHPLNGTIKISVTRMSTLTWTWDKPFCALEFLRYYCQLASEHNQALWEVFQVVSRLKKI